MPSVMSDLEKVGFSIVEPLTPQQIAETNAYLMSRPVYVDCHVPVHAWFHRNDKFRWPREKTRRSECVCISVEDSILMPNFLERGLALTGIAAEWLGRDPPVTYSINSFWTRPGNGGSRDDIQAFHRDIDDDKFLALFLYLTDVLCAADGPHELEGPDGVVRPVYGPAGTLFVANTMLPHRGRKPISHERGIAWYRWGISDRPAANEWDKIEPIVAAKLGGRYPSDPRLMESIKLLVT
jgi:hypothetical protein